ncbi:MAG: ATP phosphoribosyltransferase catalytic subunit HisG, partial [Pseudomonadota bacterium]
APLNLTAEAIIDITSSGETLRANHLKVLNDGLILASEAQLCRSLVAVTSPEDDASAVAISALI